MVQTKLGEDSKEYQETEKKVIAHELAKAQREIGVAEFFAKNRHLLGFDNKRKALLTTIKEAVDNALDACEEAEILPEISVELIELSNERFKVIVEDNGPGIVKKQIPNIFARLLYGSKFHKLAQTRGQQGIGISAAVMYGQLTTGKPAKITSKISKNNPAIYMELMLDTKSNKPKINNDSEKDWPEKDTGTRIELDLEGSYQKGSQSIDQYIKQTAIVNPHGTFIYTNPKAEQFVFPRVTELKPAKPVEIKPHPYGVELGVLHEMAQFTECRTLQSFLTTEFTRVGPGTAKEICKNSALLPNTKPKSLTRELIERLVDGIKKTKIISPPTDCISPIGEELLERGLKKEINAEFYCATTRPPSVYRGNPFIVECALAYGGEQRSDSIATIYRYANKVPLLFQQSAGVATKAITETNWRSYGLSQSTGSLPIGPVTIVVHVASVWVPFTSESKEAIAHYPEIIKEVKLAVQECGRKLSSYIHKKKRVGEELKKRGYIERYIPHVAEALQELLGYKDNDKAQVEEDLKIILEKKRGKLEKVGMDKEDNTEYDEEFAKMGKEDKEEAEEENGEE
ncbi:DNA topoisomerase VI subunit B [Candidatus Woesearchaeota archaeon CG10_big_fil_rev_8_21_14_0_10_34_8]|nr:MAG: DNA topoisomerase VI subunit B [Candidatus Woesearchaeota archaeon CG10_big_fil_rev_8_21_14_0_10_34_8]